VVGRVLAVVLLAPCLAAALAFGAASAVNDDPIDVTTARSSVVWADRVFVTRRQLAVWLRGHGARYDRWARRHPRAAARLPRR
jgi:hypothetical protein